MSEKQAPVKLMHLVGVLRVDLLLQHAYSDAREHTLLKTKTATGVTTEDLITILLGNDNSSLLSLTVVDEETHMKVVPQPTACTVDATVL